MSLKISTILLSIAGVLVGLMLEPAVRIIFDKELKDPDKILVGTSLAVGCVLLAAVTALVAHQRALSEHIADFSSRVSNLGEQLGLRVEFIPHDASSKSDPYQIVVRLAREAEREILVLDHRPERDLGRFARKIPLDARQRKTYYKLLTKRAQTPLPDQTFLRYRRVVQTADPSEFWDTHVNSDTVFAEHCKAIIDLRNAQNQCPSAIKTSRVFLPNATIVIFDGKHVLIELAISDKGGGTRIQGDLVFHDPDGVLAQPLRQLFENIDVQAVLVTSVAR